MVLSAPLIARIALYAQGCAADEAALLSEAAVEIERLQRREAALVALLRQLLATLPPA